MGLQAELVAELYHQVSIGQTGGTTSRWLRALREVVAMPYETERSTALLAGHVPLSREVFFEGRA